ncbi:interferon-induced 35 kDa protein [Odontesthes bonariensis]|uniref:interferon-induced 35 kDa protein n=1 Tax=Odontesthes bonariensis TaxID=219752 RepID=UPI003F580C86
MSSDEDFSLVTDTQPSEDTLEGVQALINNCKKQYEMLLEEHKELVDSKNDQLDMIKQFRQRTEKITQILKEDERTYREQTADEKLRLDVVKQEGSDLTREIQNIQAAIKEEEAQNAYLRAQTDVFSAMPERKFVFNGLTGDADDWKTFEMKPHITYPMEGGTALITFEEEEVASNILKIETHKLDLGGECSISVEARPVHLMVPSLVEIDSEVCSHRVLISNLPKMDTETLVNKLEIHFSKRKNGGGEVDSCEFLSDSGTVVVAFVENNIAKGLTGTEYHEVQLQQTKHRVRVTPFLNGKITNLQTKMTMCPRTVLLTGIPDVMEQETLQDIIEIHFQKNGNGGGEIEAFLYNPLGQHAEAVFGGISPNTEE